MSKLDEYRAGLAASIYRQMRTELDPFVSKALAGTSYVETVAADKRAAVEAKYKAALDAAAVVDWPPELYPAARSEALAAAWPIEDQVRALIEDAAGKPDSLKQLVTFINDLFDKYPDPS